MRVLSISHMFLTPLDPLDISVFRQMKELTEQGHDVRVLCPLPIVPFPLRHAKARWKLVASVPPNIDWDGVVTWYPRYWAFPQSLLLSSAGGRMYKGIRQCLGKELQNWRFEVVHAHMGHPDGNAGLRVSQAADKPLVVTIQATDLDITAHRNARCRKVLQHTLASARQIIAPTPRLAKQLQRDFGLEALVVGYGVDPEEICRDSERLRARYHGRKVLLSVSRLIKSKGIEFMVRALPQVIHRWKEVVYVIVGAGPERAHLQRLIRELKLNDHVELTGQLPHNHVMEYMSVCDVFVLPSWQETFGLVYVEAMAHGKPVIGVVGQGVDGIVTSGETGLLVPPRDVDALAEATIYLLAHPREARAMGEAARKLVLTEYTWEQSARKLVGVYKEVTA